MNAIDLLSEVAAQGKRVAARAHGEAAERDLLVKCGLLRDAGVLSSMACTECDEPHGVEVIFEKDGYGYFCSELGFVPIDRDDVQAVEPDLSNIASRIADAYGCARRKASPVVGRTWRVGAVSTEHGDITLFFRPRLTIAEDAQELVNAFALEPRSRWRVVIVAERGLPFDQAVIVTLGDLVSLDAEGGEMIATVDLKELVGVPLERKTGAPNRYGNALLELIEARQKGGEAFDGTNEEASALLEAFKAIHPTERPPSISTIKRYLGEARAGS